MNNPINPNEPQQHIPWGQQPQQPGPYAQQPPAPPKKQTGRNVALGCGGAVVAGMLLMGGCAALIGGTSDSNTTPPAAAGSTSPAAVDKPADGDKAKADKPADKPSKSPEKTKKPATDKVTIKVWGNAPAGALGPMDITYGSDSESINGKGLPFEKTMKLDGDAMYYHVSAQLQGSGDIHCSVTVNGTTKKGHAKGGYNICDAQVNQGLFGWD